MRLVGSSAGLVNRLIELVPPQWNGTNTVSSRMSRVMRARAMARPRLVTRAIILHTVSKYVEAGGLMSYGPNMREMFRRAATCVDRIFKGANPGDLPVEQPTTFELVINRKTAKALGLTIPRSLLISATKIME